MTSRYAAKPGNGRKSRAETRQWIPNTTNRDGGGAQATHADWSVPRHRECPHTQASQNTSSGYSDSMLGESPNVTVLWPS